MRPRLELLLASGLSLGLSACAMPGELPGELVGAYRINGALMENSCGSAALPAADPLRFDVEIRSQDQSGLWLVSSPPGHPGSLAANGEFSFTRESTYDVGGQVRQPTELLIEMDIERLADPAVAQELGEDRTRPCRLNVRERISGRLLRDSIADADGGARERSVVDDDELDADLIAENEIAVRVASGDCSASLDENGGPFERLPCQVRYDLEGELIAR
jgi:hypothetical protein